MDEITIPCNCEYRDAMCNDLTKVWQKYNNSNELHLNEFAYTMMQLATMYLKKCGASEDQILVFAKAAIESVQKKEEK